MNKENKEMNKIYFLKTRSVISPQRNNTTDAGIDFFIPSFDENFIQDLITKNPLIDSSTQIFSDYLILNPHQRILIPSGIKVKMKDGTSLIAFNKSGICTKTGLIFGAQVIDSDYSGEIHISLINSSEYPVAIKENQKIIQFIHLPIILSQMQQISEEKYQELVKTSIRKDNGFGSSDTISC